MLMGRQVIMKSRWEIAVLRFESCMRNAKVHLGNAWRLGDGDEGGNFTFFIVSSAPNHCRSATMQVSGSSNWVQVPISSFSLDKPRSLFAWNSSNITLASSPLEPHRSTLSSPHIRIGPQKFSHELHYTYLILHCLLTSSYPSAGDAFLIGGM